MIHPAQIQPYASPSAAGRSISEITIQRKLGAVVNFARGKMIFGDGDEADYSYKLVEGAVRLSKVMLDGRRQIMEFALPGGMFGFDGGGARVLSAEALTPVTVIRYRSNQIERLGEEFIDIQRELLSHLRRGWAAAHTHLVILGCQSSKQRVASFLISLSHSTAANGSNLQLPMGRQDIADYLGLTIETVCRTLTELKNKRLIFVPNRHQIIVRNLERLEALADGAEAEQLGCTDAREKGNSRENQRGRNSKAIVSKLLGRGCHAGSHISDSGVPRA